MQLMMRCLMGIDQRVLECVVAVADDDLATVVKSDRWYHVDVAVVGVGDAHTAVLTDQFVLVGVAAFERRADLLQLDLGVVVPVRVVLQVQQDIGVELVVCGDGADDRLCAQDPCGRCSLFRFPISASFLNVLVMAVTRESSWSRRYCLRLTWCRGMRGSARRRRWAWFRPPVPGDNLRRCGRR